MKKILIVLSLVMMLYAIGTAWAQVQAPEQPAAVMQPKAESPTLTLDEHYTRCMAGAGCPVQERLQIMREMHDRQRQNLDEIGQSCAQKNYADCVDPQKDEVRQWQMMHDHMQAMMQSLESPSLNMKEPGAGGNEPSTPQESWWKRTWSDVWGK